MPRESGNVPRPPPVQLAPKPISTAETTPTTLAVPNRSSFQNPSSSSLSLPPKKNSVPAACQECRKRKVKCTAERPSCNNCLARQVDCDYDTAESETPRQALKRKYTDLQHSRSVYEKIFRELHSRLEEEAHALLRQIRRGIDADTLLRYIEHGDMLQGLSLLPEKTTQYVTPLTNMPEYLRHSENLYLESLIYEWTLKGGGVDGVGQASQSNSTAVTEFYGPYLRPYNTADITDVQVDASEPSKWTTITTNDALMRALLRAYLRHEYEWSPFFQKDDFLRDMNTGSRRFCSSLLVNAILALACHCYKDLDNRAEFWIPHTLGSQFLVEAKRLWDIESKDANLTTIQTGPILHTVHILHGTDNLGWQYTMRSIQLGQETGIFKTSDGVQDQRLRAVREFTAWALFRWQSMTCYHSFHQPLLDEPPEFELPDLAKSPEWYGELWLKYPISSTLYPVNFGEQFQATSQFAVIVNEVSRAIFTRGREGFRQINYQSWVIDTYSRLQTWYQRLMEPLTARRIVFPSHLKIHMLYHQVTIQLLESLLQIHDNQSEMSNLYADTFGKVPQTILRDSKMHLETLLRVYHLRHGFEGLDIYLQIPLMFIGFMSLDAVKQPHNGPSKHSRNEILSTVILCAKGFGEQAENQFLAGVALWLLLKNMDPEDADVLKTFVNVEKIETITASRLKLVQSALPVGVVSITDDPESRRMNKLLEQC